jgi:hypothetical protein
MTKTIAAALAAIIAVLLIVMPRADICSDDVRGYERSASSSLNVSRDNLSKIEASLKGDSSVKVPTQLDGLSAMNFAAIKACDTQCKLLAQCLRFVFLKSPAQACPVEYQDYKTRAEVALTVLSGLSKIEEESKKSAQKAKALDEKRRDVADLEKTSGSTGGRLAVLKSELAQLQDTLAKDAAGLTALAVEIQKK